ncbi:cytochrome P450 [Lactifluus subvellereus]|nr:cytochrome P450 [Lactifluus subvellereus]
MQFLSITAVDCLMICFVLYLLTALQDHRRRRGYPYPPGPRSWPIIGNLFDVPNRLPWIAYTDMSKKYGDVMCLRVFDQVVVVLSSSSAIKDLLGRRGEMYSDRPLFRLHQVLGTGWLLPVLPKGEAWLEGRKLLDRSLRPGAPTTYRRMMEEKTRVFLGQLLTTPKNFRDHLELFEGKLIMSLTYGYDLKTHDDKMIEAPVEINKILMQIVLPGAAIMNHLPFLQYIHSWIPYYSYETMARRSRVLCQRMRDDPINFVRQSMREGTAVPSLASECLQEIEPLRGPERQKQETVVQETLGSLFDAGADTTVSAMLSLFLALTLHPEVQKRAQAELDSVLGRDRLPTFDDKPRLPYIDALFKELLRWRMVVPLGFPHSSSEDGVYNGYFIPKGTIIIANAWGVLHDPELYPDPETFNPERFLNVPATGAVRTPSGTPLNDPSAIPLAFGAGKRICPGRHFVEATLFILAASVLAVFDVSKPRSKDGEDRGASGESSEIENTIICVPGKFECSIIPRDKLSEDLIVANVMA